MGAIITAGTVCAGGGHLGAVTVELDGITVTVPAHSDSTAWTPAERVLLAEYLIRRLRAQGVTPAQLVGRVCLGEEATNVKQYDILAAGSVVTKTNIGTSYVDVLLGANGCRSLVDFTGGTQFRLILTANLIGSGPFGARLVRDSDTAVLYEQANLGAAGERELDTDWQALPAQAAGLILVRLQAKSQTAADDPIFRRCVLLVK